MMNPKTNPMSEPKPKATVRFSTSVKGDITDLEVTANGYPLKVTVENGEFTCHFNGKITGGNAITVIYEITGLTGTAYSISYTCSADGINKSDPLHPSPVTGTIDIGNNDTKTVTIQI